MYYLFNSSGKYLGPWCEMRIYTDYFILLFMCILVATRINFIYCCLFTLSLYNHIELKYVQHAQHQPIDCAQGTVGSSIPLLLPCSLRQRQCSLNGTVSPCSSSESHVVFSEYTLRKTLRLTFVKTPPSQIILLDSVWNCVKPVNELRHLHVGASSFFQPPLRCWVKLRLWFLCVIFGPLSAPSQHHSVCSSFLGHIHA